MSSLSLPMTQENIPWPGKGFWSRNRNRLATDAVWCDMFHEWSRKEAGSCCRLTKVPRAWSLPDVPLWNMQVGLVSHTLLLVSWKFHLRKKMKTFSRNSPFQGILLSFLTAYSYLNRLRGNRELELLDQVWNLLKISMWFFSLFIFMPMNFPTCASTWHPWDGRKK